jgi:hypothetical protein
MDESVLVVNPLSDMALLVHFGAKWCKMTAWLD